MVLPALFGRGGGGKKDAPHEEGKGPRDARAQGGDAGGAARVSAGGLWSLNLTLRSAAPLVLCWARLGVPPLVRRGAGCR